MTQHGDVTRAEVRLQRLQRRHQPARAPLQGLTIVVAETKGLLPFRVELTGQGRELFRRRVAARHHDRHRARRIEADRTRTIAGADTEIGDRHGLRASRHEGGSRLLGSDALELGRGRNSRGGATAERQSDEDDGEDARPAHASAHIHEACHRQRRTERGRVSIPASAQKSFHHRILRQRTALCSALAHVNIPLLQKCDITTRVLLG